MIILDLARDLKKTVEHESTIIPVVIGALGTVTEGLKKGLENLEIIERVETIQITALLRSATILRRVPGESRRLAVTQILWKTIS